jgi:AcrR family transcriptional regulator
MSRKTSVVARRDGRSDRWKDHRESRRRDLISAVMEVVTELGADVGMDDISRASGVAKPVFYRYFKDKADLFVEVGRAAAETVVYETTAAIDAAESPRAKLTAGIDAYLAGIESRQELYRFVVRHRDPDDYATMVGLHATAVIAELMDQLGLETDAAEVWGFGIVGLVRAVADRWLEHRNMTRAEVVRHITDLIWPGEFGLAAGFRRAAATGTVPNLSTLVTEGGTK